MARRQCDREADQDEAGHLVGLEVAITAVMRTGSSGLKRAGSFTFHNRAARTSAIAVIARPKPQERIANDRQRVPHAIPLTDISAGLAGEVLDFRT